MWVWETKGNPIGTVVIVHGSGEHHGRYEWLRQQWLDRQFHVVMGDLPGQGQHPKKRGHIDRFDEYLDAIENWVNRAKQFDLPIILLGHSLGGLAVIRTVQERKLDVKALILSSPCLGLVMPPKKLLITIGNMLNYIKPDFLFRIKRSTDNQRATRNKDVLARDAKDPLIIKKVSARWFCELNIAMRQAFEKVDHVPNIPTLILQAGHDKIVDKISVEKWYNQLGLKHKAYKEWDGLFHEVFNEPERKQVFDYTMTFIDQF